MILINFKIYKETFGEGAVRLAKVIKKVAEKYKTRIVVTSSALDAVRLKELGVEVWLQSVDEHSEGKHTGWVSMEQASALGINGSLLNHFEHQIMRGTIGKIIKQRPEGFLIVLCVKTVGQIEKWAAAMKPDYILYEPPELIGLTDRSVASEKPESIKKAVELANGIPLMVGAGVKSGEDVEISLKMGAKAVGLASGMVLADDPEKVLSDIAEGFNGV